MTEHQDNRFAFQYAFALAIRHHLTLVELHMKSEQFSANQSDDETIQFEDTINDLVQVRSHAFDKILNNYKVLDCQGRKYHECLSNTLEGLLLGPDIRLFDVPSTLKTSTLIEKVEKELKEPLKPWLGSLRSGKLSEKLYLVLMGTLIEDESFDTISLFVSCYLKDLTSKSHIFGESKSMIFKIDSVVDLLNRSHVETTTNLYQRFQLQLNSHLKLITFDSKNNMELVSKLREQGNNLMSNRGYAQALRIYTNALDLCQSFSAEMVSQLLVNRAITYIGLFCFPEAISDLNEAINYEPSFTPAWAQLAYCHLYMGNSLVSLKCYLITLRTANGEILPKNFPSDDAELVADYRAMKVKCILPQFAQKIVQSIALVEKRAYQQIESSTEIKRIISEVRKILTALRSTAAETDRDYFVYYPHLRDSMLRSISERVIRNRPSILTPEAAQNVMVNNSTGGFPTEEVPVASDSLENAWAGFHGPRSRNQEVIIDIATTGTPQGAAMNAARAAAAAGVARSGAAPPVPTTSPPPPPSMTIRNILNSFGDMMEDRPSTAPAAAAAAAATASAPSATSTGAERSQTEDRTLGPERTQTEDRVLGPEAIFREFLPDSLAPAFAHLSNAFNGNNSFTTRRVFVNGQEVDSGDHPLTERDGGDDVSMLDDLD